MELRIALNPADLDRFRAHSILKTFRNGRPRNSVEQGDTPHSFRLTRSVYALGGGAWSAGMVIRHGLMAGIPVCFADFRLLSGPPAPLCALLMALADAVPFEVGGGDPTLPPAPIKAKPPPLLDSMGCGEGFALIADSAIAHLAANHDCLMRTGEAEAIHQMRVALRRLRSAMSMFREILDDPESVDLRPELQWLQRTLGAARDWDVLLAETVVPLQELFGGTAGYEKLCLAIADRRQRARASALADLATPRMTRLMLRLAFWCDAVGRSHPQADRPVGELARAILDKRHRKIKKQMDHFGELSIDGRHQCRIDIKKLRYAVDFFAGLFPAKRGQRLLPLLAALQDRLGALNDIAVARSTIEALVLEEGAADMAWAAGQLMGWHAGRSSGLLAQIVKDWDAVERLPAFWRD